MPKRKQRKNDVEHINRKIKKLQKKLRNKYKEDDDDDTRSRDSRSSSPSRSGPRDGHIMEPDANAWLGYMEPEAGSSTMIPDIDATQPEAVVVISTPDINPEPASEAPPPPPPAETTVDEADITASNEPELDSIALEILGTDPSVEIKYGQNIQKDLSKRLEHIAVSGLSKELRKEITSKYLTPANCTLIDPPTLNEEIKAASSELVVKRDKAIEFKQKQLAAAISCIGAATSKILASKDKDAELLKMLMDANRILCDCQNADSKTRKSFTLSTLKPDMKTQLQNTKIDKWLFGENLQETIKSAKGITKSSTELKAINIPRTQPTQNRGPTSIQASRHLNYKGPAPGRRPPGAPRTWQSAPRASGSARAPPPPAHPNTSYRPSQRRHDAYRR